MPASPAATALALLRVPGVGRVTVHRLRAHFPTLDALHAAPREQVFLRIRRSPRAADLAERLLDDAVTSPRLAEAEAEIQALAQRGVRVLAPPAPPWPAQLDALDDAARPVALFAYGNLGALAQPLVAFLARPPLPGPAFEQAQAVARAALARGLGLALGAAHGFDLALLKIAADARVPSVAVLACGLGQLAPSFRPAATTLVRAGGLLLSPFPMGHGPFAHDDAERALVQAALGRATCRVALPDGSPEAAAAAWLASRHPDRMGTVGAAPGAAGAALDTPEAADAFLASLTA